MPPAWVTTRRVRTNSGRGDCVTAPELGNVFPEIIAQTLAGTLLQLAEPTLLELGAGSGALAVDLLQALARRGALPARYLILERSADLRERQRVHIAAATPQWLERIEWLEQPPEQAFDGAIIGNEVVDALACARFVVAADGPREICVEVVAGRFVAVAKEPREQLARSLANLQSDLPQPLPPGYVSEVNPELAAWFATMQRAAASRTGPAGRLWLRSPGVLPGGTHHGHHDLPLPPSRPR